MGPLPQTPNLPFRDTLPPTHQPIINQPHFLTSLSCILPLPLPNTRPHDPHEPAPSPISLGLVPSLHQHQPPNHPPYTMLTSFTYFAHPTYLTPGTRYSPPFLASFRTSSAGSILLPHNLSGRPRYHQKPPCHSLSSSAQKSSPPPPPAPASPSIPSSAPANGYIISFFLASSSPAPSAACGSSPSCSSPWSSSPSLLSASLPRRERCRDRRGRLSSSYLSSLSWYADFAIFPMSSGRTAWIPAY